MTFVYYISSICALVVPAVCLTLFFASIVEAVEKKGKVKWMLLIVSIALICSKAWGYHEGHEAAIEEAQLVEVEGYTYTIDFNGQLHEYAGGYNYTK